MLKPFQEHLSAIAGNSSDKKFLLAVSGGLDSVAMAALFNLSGYAYSIAHCNFQLRGKESDADEQFVKELAGKYNVPFFSIKFETESFCNQNKVSVQMGARQLRYQWLEETRQANRLDYVVTAHHADDAIETFFINILRGTGISGLHGIKAINGNIIRPMLHLYRNSIEQFAHENKLTWREDSSNNTDKYERNKIRHHLLPMLEEINPKAKEAITTTIENVGSTELVFNNAIERITHKYIRHEGERTYIHFNFLKELDHAAEYLYEVVKKNGFNYEQCKQITESPAMQSGKVFLSESHCLTIDREELIIEPKAMNEHAIFHEVGEQQEAVSTDTHTYLFNRLKNTDGFQIPTEPEKAALDFDKLSFPLQIRKWQEGDRFYPLGMKNPKKVSDFLIDNKVSMPDKESVHVLISGDEIAWLIGYRTDERFKITKPTKNVYLCKLQKANTP